jgi:hypothetical protein
MPRIRRCVPSPAMAVALAALVVAIGGQAAYAAATNFLLNTTNTSNAQTTLNGSAVAGKALQLTNTNTAAGATALGLTVAAGRAPFTTNSSTKVTNLNADLLDGINSTGFVQGSAHVLSNRIGFTVPNDGNFHDANALTIPGIGTVSVECQTDTTIPENSAALIFTNTSGGLLDVTAFRVIYENANTDPSLIGTDPSLQEQILANNAQFNTGPGNAVATGQTAIAHFVLQAGAGTGTTSHLTTITASVSMTIPSQTCAASAQAVTSP